MLTTNQEEYRDYLATPYWLQVSREVKKRAKWRCQVCNSPLDLCAHHRTYEHRGDELNHLDDLICLCKRCHKIFHAVEKEESRKFKRRATKLAPEPEESLPVAPSNKDLATSTRVLDSKLIKSLRICGGMTAATLEALGLDWSFTRQPNWMNRLRGRLITEEAYQLALDGKHKRVGKRKRTKIR